MSAGSTAAQYENGRVLVHDFSFQVWVCQSYFAGIKNILGDPDVMLLQVLEKKSEKRK